MRQVEIDEEDGSRETSQFIWCCVRCRDTPDEDELMSLPIMEGHYVVE